MKLSECKLGITENVTKESIPEAQWQDGAKYGCHYNNLTRYEG